MKAEIYSTKYWVNTSDKKKLFKNLNKSLENANFKIINFIEHFFENQGYTCLWLISESHLALHTFPEANKSYIELSSCNNNKNEHFKQLLNKYFQVI